MLTTTQIKAAQSILNIFERDEVQVIMGMKYEEKELQAINKFCWKEDWRNWRVEM